MAEKYCLVKDVDHKLRISKLLDQIAAKDCDVIFLQEVTDTIFELVKVHSIQNKYHCCKTIMLEPYGLVILSKVEMDWQSYRWGKKGHKQILVCQIGPLQIVNLHLTAGGNADMRSSQINDIIRTCVAEGSHTLLCGDFNFCTEEETVKGWIDLCPKEEKGTYTFDHNRNIYAAPIESSHRFDRIYSNKAIQLIDYSVDTSNLSDHYMISTTIVL